MKHLLVVEPDAILGQRVLARCERIARATLCRDFLSARSQLLASTPDLLVTNLRLEEYNGLHLVLLASSEGVTRSLVHTDWPDPYLVREAQAIGAFFERTERLLHAVVGYLHFDLPQRDRRTRTATTGARPSGGPSRRRYRPSGPTVPRARARSGQSGQKRSKRQQILYGMRVTRTYLAATLLALCAMVRLAAQAGAANGEWRTYGGDLGHTRYAPLDQINASNFKALEIAWRFKTDAFGPRPRTSLSQRR